MRNSQEIGMESVGNAYQYICRHVVEGPSSVAHGIFGCLWRRAFKGKINVS